MKISEDNLTPKEKEIYKHFKDRYLSEEYHPLILYSVQQLDIYSLTNLDL